jgi:hypothetical protein
LCQYHDLAHDLYLYLDLDLDLEVPSSSVHMWIQRV